MLLSDFINRNSLKKKLPFPTGLTLFHKDSPAKEWNIEKIDETFYVQKCIGNETQSYPLDELLRLTLPAKENIQLVHKAIVDYYQHNNYKDGLPLYFVRGHGGHKDTEAESRRRRGWMVKFKNAYIVYADNFLTRHFFEYTFFASQVTYQDIQDLICAHLLPFSSGGGRFEKRHRVFPALAHLTSQSQLYLSHLYDINKNDYYINGHLISANNLLGDRQKGNFGYGHIKDWDEGTVVVEDKKCRVIDECLNEATLAFLQASNIRCLSPFNYFPCPKPSALRKGSISGEDTHLRNEVIKYHLNLFGKEFEKFVEEAKAPSLFHKEGPVQYEERSFHRPIEDEGKRRQKSFRTTKRAETDEFTKEELISRIQGWKSSPGKKVHKIIDRIFIAGGRIKRHELASYLKTTLLIQKPEGSLYSLMSNKRKQYGKTLAIDGEHIIFHPDIAGDVTRIWSR
jgi:hypothetical protein